MEIQDMTREQLIKYIDTLNKHISKLNNAKPANRNTNTNLSVFDEKSEALLNELSIGLVITDPDGAIINFNRTVQDLLGYSLEDYKNMNVSDLYFDPSDRQKLMDLLSQSKITHDFETKLKHKDGRLRTVLANTDYIEMNNKPMLLTSLYDITQYMQLQENLRESEKSYRTLFSYAPIGITVSDFQGNIIADNQALQELLGYNVEELNSKNMLDFYYEKSARQQLLDLTKELGIVRDFETRYRHKNGSAIPVLINTDLIDFKNHRDVLLTSIRDISNLKKIEDELTKERDFSNAVLDITASLILVIDREGMITRFNRACEKTSGYSFDEMRGKNFMDANMIDPTITEDMIVRLLNGNYPSIHENIWYAKSGEKHLISWTDTTLIDDKGQIEYIIATGIDITERQQAENELQKANQELASRVKELQERTKEMNQLNEMGEQLQSCHTIAEACAIGAQYIQRICPTSHGALYLINASRNFAEATEMWGDPPYTREVFTPLSCWAIRRGRQHLIDDSHPGLRCEHITGPQSGQYLCLPLLVNGEAIGILHLNHPIAPQQDQQETMCSLNSEHKIELIKSVVEQIALALSSLKLRETLRQQSIRDALTGLYNRRYLEETLERELKWAEREKRSVSVIMLDIDHFKEFNDLAGHDGGDALLRELGIFFKKSTRGGDIACRYGGEEFLIVMPGINKEDAQHRAEELRLGVKELLVYHLGKPLGKCTISLGVAVFPEHGQTIEEMLKAADNALYRAKNDGRDRVVFA